MIRPVGKMPSVVPGKTNLPLAAALALAAAAAVVLAAVWSAKTPQRKDASLVESSVVTVEPFCAFPERAIWGDRSLRDVVL